jgi:hypothetical protein
MLWIIVDHILAEQNTHSRTDFHSRLPIGWENAKVLRKNHGHVSTSTNRQVGEGGLPERVPATLDIVRPEFVDPSGVSTFLRLPTEANTVEDELLNKMPATP